METLDNRTITTTMEIHWNEIKTILETATLGIQTRQKKEKWFDEEQSI